MEKPSPGRATERFRLSRRFSQRRGITLVLIYFALAALPLVLAYLVNPHPRGTLLEELGKGTALVGFALLALQVVLSSRLNFMEGPYGLDMVMLVHKSMAVFAGVLLLSHPLLLAAGGHGLGLLGFDTPLPVTLGKIALILLLVVIVAALTFKKLGIKYQLWRRAHKSAILVVILGAAHGMWIGSDLQNTAMRAYWWTLFVISVGLFTYRNIYVQFWGRRRFKVVSVTPESHDTYTVAMEPEKGKPLLHLPGQFQFLRLDRPGRPSEEHPFTISSSPTGEPPVTATIKRSGDFTNTIGQTQTGDLARIEAPFGRFTFLHHEPRSFLFIAGGVGITPIRSMLAYLRDTADERPAVLIYGNKTQKDILFREELEALPENVKVVHVLSAPGEDWDGYRGNVTEEIIKEESGHVLGDAHVYLCGPPPMMKKVLASLRSLGVPDSRIHYERFAL